ncbi:hypothetical protein NQ318_017437 [Aromia moschata]|uniref:Vacuolar protein sorting-associated protein TDA6 n=1 Tax=Aromia moschata TaxID=1265417 RepID=A0AAV8Z525_9CUCU|nr:hypothetical protein NQ318_017437 [Aromia moschata]
MIIGGVLYFLLLCVNVVINSQLVDITEGIDRLVKQWSPLIWLSPDEKYMPLGVEEFLSHVHVADENGKNIRLSNSRLPSGYNSKLFYLVTKETLDSLKSDNTSHSVPVYAIVTHCSSYKSFHTSDKNNLKSDINAIYNKRENNFYFYVSYWTFFPYNEGKEICFLGRVPAPKIFSRCFGRLKTMGNHVGDWEHMSLSFAGNAFPDKLFLAVHDAGVYYQYDEKRRYFKFESKVIRKGVVQVPKFPQIVRSQGGHPVLFSAYGSHGLWASPGEHDFIRVPKLTDKNG